MTNPSVFVQRTIVNSKKPKAQNSHYAMIPFLPLDDDRLDPYAITLYAHYIQRGLCFERNETTAKATRMGLTKMKAARKLLAATGYISVIERVGGTHLVEVLNIWERNRENYLRLVPDPNSCAEQGVSLDDTPLTRGDTKEDHIEEDRLRFAADARSQDQRRRARSANAASIRLPASSSKELPLADLWQDYCPKPWSDLKPYERKKVHKAVASFGQGQDGRAIVENCFQRAQGYDKRNPVSYIVSVLNNEAR